MRKDENKDIPADLNWDNMKDGIFEKMSSLSSAEGKTPKTGLKRFGWLYVFASMALLLLGFMVFKSVSEKDGVEAPLSNYHLQLPAIVVKGTSPKQGITEASNNPPEKAGVLSPIGLNQVAENPKGDISNVKSQASASSTRTKIALPQMRTLISWPEAKGQLLYFEDYQRVTPLQLASILYPWTQGSDSLDNSDVGPQNPQTPVAQVDSTSSVENHGPEEMLSPFKGSSLAKKQNPYGPGIISIETGLVMWTEGLNAAGRELRTYETTLPSFQIQAQYQYQLKNDFFLLFGAQYQELYSKSAYRESLPNYQLTFEDTIVRIYTDVLTGEQMVERGDVSQEVEAEYVFQNYNSSKLLKGSIGLGKSMRWYSLETDFFLGALVNLVVFNEGRTYFKDTIVDYRGYSNSFYQNQYAVDLLAGLRVHYRLNAQLRLSSSLQVARSLNDWSSDADFAINPTMFSLQFGFSYKLN